ncbi:MAG TPA: hypothetical protein DIW81_08695, partial [Planctomycetaceae bacterium]|nr:hypothetical protein [Planctomycetaceae bacterium]
GWKPVLPRYLQSNTNEDIKHNSHRSQYRYQPVWERLMASVQETRSSSSIDETQFSEGVAAFREAVKPLASLKLSV